MTHVFIMPVLEHGYKLDYHKVELAYFKVLLTFFHLLIIKVPIQLDLHSALHSSQDCSILMGQESLILLLMHPCWIIFNKHAQTSLIPTPMWHRWIV